MKKILLVSLFTGFLLSNIGAQQLKRAVMDTHVDSVWQGINLPTGYTGKDVIIGITDWGFDYTHPVFYDTAMNQYRILRVWDQYRHEGTPPQGFDYGVEYIGKEALLAAGSDTSNVYNYGYHGTHVGGIAAGAGAGTNYRGVSFESDLLFATFLVNEKAVIDAFRWMQNVAEAEGKRLVINMSWGLYYMDNLDGTGELSKVMDTLAEEGVVFVTSAGNNGDVNMHLEHNFNNDTVKSLVGFDISSVDAYWGQSLHLTNTANTPFCFTFNVLDNGNNLLATAPFFSTQNNDFQLDSFLLISTDTVFYRINSKQNDPYNHRPEVRLRIKKNPNYKIALVAAGDSGTFHAWNIAELSNDVGNWGNTFTAINGLSGWKNGDAYYGLGTPANFDACITVAAYRSEFTLNNNKYGGEIASFSSYGTTLDNRSKPEIAAPGVSVNSAISSFASYSGQTSAKVSFEGKDYIFSALSGTSMSSPFAAGVVALILQANPYLTAKEVKEIITTTARTDSYTNSSGTIRFGAGKINAYQAVKLALETTSVVNNNRLSLKIYPNPTAHYCTIETTENAPIGKIEIYNLMGQRLIEETYHNNTAQIDLSTLCKGIYVLKINQEKSLKLVKK